MPVNPFLVLVPTGEPSRAYRSGRMISHSKVELPGDPSSVDTDEVIVSPAGTNKTQWQAVADLGGGGGGGHVIEDEGNALPQQPIMDFQGPGVVATNDAPNGKTVISILGGGGEGGGHVIQEEGSSLPQQGILDFVGPGVTALDDPANSATQVNVPHTDWTDVPNKPSTFPPENHIHDDLYYRESEVDAKIAIPQADIDNHILDTNNPHQVTYADLPDQPTSFPPDPHAHDDRYYTETEIDSQMSGKADNGHLLDTHGDVNVPAPSDGDQLVYDKSADEWKASQGNTGLSIVRFNYNMFLPPTSTPASGDVSRNNADPLLATTLYIHATDADGVNENNFWNEIKAGDWFNIYDQADSANHEAYDVTGPAVLNTDIWSIPVVSFQAEGSGLLDNMAVTVLWRIKAVADHSELTGTGDADSHPQSAITGLVSGQAAQDTNINSRVLRAGDTMTGALDMDTFAVSWGSFSVQHNGVDDSLEFIVGGSPIATLKNSGILEVSEIHEV